MSSTDRLRWDDRYADGAKALAVAPCLPTTFEPFADHFPAAGHAVDIACGRGAGAVWLARRGMDVVGLDVSPVAVDQATALARANAVAQRCRFEVTDLDDGLPTGPPADVVLCSKFRDPRLDEAIVARLAPRGLLAISALSEVGAHPGPFRARPGELLAAFGALMVIAEGERHGLAWLLARRLD